MDGVGNRECMRFVSLGLVIGTRSVAQGETVPGERAPTVNDGEPCFGPSGVGGKLMLNLTEGCE
jgi:hypothetical protein